jgi:hypothetical protein
MPASTATSRTSARSASGTRASSRACRSFCNPWITCWLTHPGRSRAAYDASRIARAVRGGPAGTVASRTSARSASGTPARSRACRSFCKPWFTFSGSASRTSARLASDTRGQARGLGLSFCKQLLAFSGSAPTPGVARASRRNLRLTDHAGSQGTGLDGRFQNLGAGDLGHPGSRAWVSVATKVAVSGSAPTTRAARMTWLQ